MWEPWFLDQDHGFRSSKVKGSISIHLQALLDGLDYLSEGTKEAFIVHNLFMYVLLMASLQHSHNCQVTVVFTSS